MYKAKQRMKTLLLACFAALVSMFLAVALWVTPTSKIDASAAEQTETISVFGTTGTLASDESSISWVSGNCTFTNAKGSTAIRTSDSDHYRVYANSTIKISVNEGSTITKIVITCTSASYATVCQTSFNNAEPEPQSATVSGSIVTIILANSTTSITATASAQTRFKTVAITYTEASSEPTCEHTNTTSTTDDATCTEAGSITVTCNDCGETVSTEEIPVIAHNYVDGTCSVCGAVEPNEVTLTFDDTSKRTIFTTEQQVWTENGITVTNNKANSTTNVADYANPIRFYMNSELIIEYPGMTKIVFSCNTAAYANNLQSSIEVSATVEEKVVTVTLAAATDTFTITLSEGQVRMDSITVHVSTCEHTNTTEITNAPTCTETGSTTVTCDDCGAKVSETTIPALGHNYVDNFCSVCGEQDPATIDYSGYYYISFTHSETVYYVDNSELSSNRYYARTDVEFTAGTVNIAYVYRLIKTENGIYSLCEYDGDCYQENITVEKIDGAYRFYATVDGSACQFLLNAGSGTKYIKFYKASNATQSNYAQDITLTPVDFPANIESASITIGEDITMNYYVTMSDEFAEAKMYFTVDGKTYEVGGVEKEVNENKRYVFSLDIPPHFMANNIKAELKLGDAVLAIKAEYSVKEYAQNMLNKIADGTQADANGTLKQLLTDLLYYGDAAYNYANKTTDAVPATDGVENLGSESTAEPTATDFTLTKNEEISSYPAYFLGAGVYFDNVNQIYVKINTTENVTLTINGVEAEITGNMIYTDGILATGFDDTYEFKLYHNDVLMQTLTYSVNAYAYAKQGDATMGELALALYRYGASATAYKA
ncbi:MAG: hypothetical protein IJD77_04555 [Clostridia bacterium]|nr:hypothetical protein [Clostridia bacterium]